MPDLLGGPDWKVYRVDDYEWYVARNRDEAIAAALSAWGCESVEQAVREDMLDPEYAYELGDEELDGLIFADSDGDDEPIHVTRRTFRDELTRRVAAGLTEAELFAATDW